MKFLSFRKLTFIFLLSVGFIFPSITMAQEPEDPCPIPFEPCPIDDGLLLLLGAAVFIAAKKTVHYKKSIQAV